MGFKVNGTFYAREGNGCGVDGDGNGHGARCGLVSSRVWIALFSAWGISLDVKGGEGRYEDVCETGQCLLHLD